MTIPFVKRVLAEELNREQCMLDTIDRFSRHLPDGHLNIKQGRNGPVFQHSMMHEGKRTRVTIDPEWDGAEKLIRELANKSVIQHSKPILIAISHVSAKRSHPSSRLPWPISPFIRTHPRHCS